MWRTTGVHSWTITISFTYQRPKCLDQTKPALFADDTDLSCYGFSSNGFNFRSHKGTILVTSGVGSPTI